MPKTFVEARRHLTLKPFGMRLCGDSSGLSYLTATIEPYMLEAGCICSDCLLEFKNRPIE